MTRAQSWLMVMLAAGPAALGGLALAAQDRYTVKVPGGLAFAEFRGYENWQLVAVCAQRREARRGLWQSGDDRGFQGGVPATASPFPTAP